MDEADADEATVGNAAFILALREHGVRDRSILRAMEQVPRALFAPSSVRAYARRDIALPLPCGQTMTAPTSLAAMLSALDVRPGATILEIGTGSGYATALLTRLGAEHVRSVERYATLAASARANLAAFEVAGADVETGDGLEPHGTRRYDRILVNGTLDPLLPTLVHALSPNGRLVAGVATGEGVRVLTAQSRDGELERSVGGKIRLTPLSLGHARVL